MYKGKPLAQIKAIEKANKEFLLKMNPDLNDDGGIYFLTRTDENGFKFAYIGQSRQSAGILTRLSQHMLGWKQHIDLSIKSHKWYSDENPYGWKVGAVNFPDSELDEMEKYWIKKYADNGYQLRNVSLGSQTTGRNMINQTKPSKGYRDGIEAGRKQLAKELNHIINTHLIITLKKDTKISRNALEKFNNLLNITDEYQTNGQ